MHFNQNEFTVTGNVYVSTFAHHVVYAINGLKNEK